MLALYFSTILSAQLLSWILSDRLHMIDKVSRYSFTGLSEINTGGVHGILFSEFIFKLITVLWIVINLYIALLQQRVVMVLLLLVSAIVIYIGVMYRSFGKVNVAIYNVNKLYEQLKSVDYNGLSLEKREVYLDIAMKYSNCFMYNKCRLELSTDGKLVEVQYENIDSCNTIKETFKTNYDNALESFKVYKECIFNFLLTL